MATRDSVTQPAATAADTARFVLDVFSERQVRIYALATTLRQRLEELTDDSGEPRDPVALKLCEILEEQAQDATATRAAERLLGLASAVPARAVHSKARQGAARG